MGWVLRLPAIELMVMYTEEKILTEETPAPKFSPSRRHGTAALPEERPASGARTKSVDCAGKPRETATPETSASNHQSPRKRTAAASKPMTVSLERLSKQMKLPADSVKKREGSSTSSSSAAETTHKRSSSSAVSIHPRKRPHWRL